MARLVTPGLLLLMLVSALVSLGIGSASVPIIPGLIDWISGRNSLAAIVIV